MCIFCVQTKEKVIWDFVHFLFFFSPCFSGVSQQHGNLFCKVKLDYKQLQSWAKTQSPNNRVLRVKLLVSFPSYLELSLKHGQLSIERGWWHFSDPKHCPQLIPPSGCSLLARSRILLTRGVPSFSRQYIPEIHVLRWIFFTHRNKGIVFLRKELAGN